MNTEYISAKKILSKTGISVLDAARIAKNILDAKPNNFNLTVLQFCAKVVAMGLQHTRTKEMTFADGFALYLKSKQHLRPDSIRDTMKPWQNAKQFAIHANIGRLPPALEWGNA